MTAKKQPTTAQKLDRIDRRQIRMEKKLDARIEDDAMHAHLIDSIRILADHVGRLTREKESLVKMIGWAEVERQLATANDAREKQ